MGYLDNSSITVDAILTKKGRELLARNDGSFKITQFALADDEIDYGLFNENHPNGSQYSGEAIENMNLIEAIPDENNIMRSKLISLQGVSVIPYITVDNANPIKSLGQEVTITPQTFNMNGMSTGQTESQYVFRIADGRLVQNFVGNGGSGTNNGSTTSISLTPFSLTTKGTSLSMTCVTVNTIFGANSGLITTITITGVDTGATKTIPFIVTVSPNDTGATAIPSTY